LEKRFGLADELALTRFATIVERKEAGAIASSKLKLMSTVAIGEVLCSFEREICPVRDSSIFCLLDALAAPRVPYKTDNLSKNSKNISKGAFGFLVDSSAGKPHTYCVSRRTVKTQHLKENTWHLNVKAPKRAPISAKTVVYYQLLLRIRKHIKY
tara:strand:- start:123 stop:587 length:465 start_codon:yes stop_codon:yes gene_type:complete